MNTALVTGASSGIGKALATVHAQHGGNLVLVARSHDKLIRLKEELENEYCVSVLVIEKDLTQDNAAKEILDEVMEREFPIDYLFNNAGTGEVSSFLQPDWWRYQQMIELNSRVLTEMCYRFSNYLIEKKRSGKIMNVASTAAFQPIPNMAVYAATKAYVLSLSESLSVELAKDNITVTALCPGPTRTDFVEGSNVNKEVSSLPIFASAEEVAKYGYKQMLKGETIVIPGAINRLQVNTTRLLPRKTVPKLFGAIMGLGKK